MKKRVFILALTALLLMLWCGASWSDDDTTAGTAPEAYSIEERIINFVADASPAGKVYDADDETDNNNDGEDKDDENDNTTDDSSTDSNDPLDPDSSSWDGLTMPVTLDTSGDVASGLKPKIVWSGTTNLNAGTASTITATITNPVEEINVYIAAKDALKLYGVSHKLTKATARDIPLTSADIKEYNIPFRVTAVNSKDNTATGDKNNDKNAKTIVTVAFNGGNFEYKNFPITISAKNKNTGSKPVTKTVTLNVTPNTDAPEWWLITSSDLSAAYADGVVYVTYSTNELKRWEGWYDIGKPGQKVDEYTVEDYKGQTITVNNLHVINYYVGDYECVPMCDTKGNPLEVSYRTDSNGKLIRRPYTDSQYGNEDDTTRNQKLTTDQQSYMTKYGTTAEQRGKYWYYILPTTFYINVSLDVKDLPSGFGGIVYSYTSFDKKSKPEVPVSMYSNNGTITGNTFTSETYSVKAPAPYVIQTKDLSAKGITVNITQPEFDYLGRNTVSGSVTITGTLAKKGKISVPLTASNPSTGKKTALKVSVVGTLLKDTDHLSFPKAKSFTFSTSSLDESVKSDAWILDSSDVYSQARSKIVTKRVAMPKLPNVKFTAKGAKPITYKLGLYDADGSPDGRTAYYRARSEFDGSSELWNYMYYYVISHDLFDEYGEEYNNSLLTKLSARGLSFDEKKGKVVLSVKKGKTTPTLDEDEENLKSIDIAATATNTLGSAQAWAEVVITGEKPKLYDKTVTISGTVSKGQIFTFDLAAGKTLAKDVTDSSANVKTYTLKDSDAKTLSDWGLELVNYDSILVASGDEWVRSKDITRKNYGLIQVTDPDTLVKLISDAKASSNQVKALRKLKTGKKVNLRLYNLGATGKGKLTVSLSDNITSSDTAGSSTTQKTAADSVNDVSIQKTGGTLSYVPEGFETETDSPNETESPVTIGAPRTAADLSAAQRAYIESRGYKIIAVLPEIKSDVEGQEDFSVELDEDAPAGAKMIYLPFPDVQETEDDNIIDFYDKAGAPIEDVPAERNIVASPWLREGVTYEPVIAVED